MKVIKFFFLIALMLALFAVVARADDIKVAVIWDMPVIGTSAFEGINLSVVFSSGESMTVIASPVVESTQTPGFYIKFVTPKIDIPEGTTTILFELKEGEAKNLAGNLSYGTEFVADVRRPGVKSWTYTIGSGS